MAQEGEESQDRRDHQRRHHGWRAWWAGLNGRKITALFAVLSFLGGAGTHALRRNEEAARREEATDRRLQRLEEAVKLTVTQAQFQEFANAGRESRHDMERELTDIHGLLVQRALWDNRKRGNE